MSDITRRTFLRYSTTAATAAGVGLSLNAAGANEKVVIGLMGLRGRGNYLAPLFAQRDDVEIKWLADPDSNFFESRSKTVADAQGGKAPKCTQDFREMLDDPEVDAIINATPNHWHALGTILACQAGKDVYVEKPTCHNIWEGRKMIEAARKYDRVVQVGTQNRSADYNYAAYEFIRQADFGSIHYVRVLNSKPRRTIGNAPDEPVPEGVDYDMWLGPAQYRPFNKNHFHYSWNWFWDFGAGDISNDGVHQIDIARWLIDQDYPKSVYASGGSHYFDDAQETPDTQIAVYDFDGLTMVFEQCLWSPYMRKTPFEMRDTDNLPTWPFSGTHLEVHGSKQMMYLGRHGGGWQAFDGDWNSVHIEHGRFKQTELNHIENFIQCIRDRKQPNADIEKGHLSTNLCHFANTSYRLGRKLFIDAEKECYIDDAEANTHLKRDFREPWVVPEEV